MGIALHLLVLPSAAFQDWSGFRFGTRPSVKGADNFPFAVASLEGERLVVAGRSFDSSCCRFDSVGEFGPPLAWSGSVPFIGSLGRDASAWNPDLQWGYRPGLMSPGWWDLQPDGRGGLLVVGTIADTVLFNGTRRIGYGWDAPDSTDGMDRAAILARGGGGGVGFGSWADSGVDLRLLRFGSGVGRSSGTQVLNSPSGPIVIGSFEADSPGVLFEGVDSFAFPRGASCFAFHANGGTGGKWFVSAACRPFASPTAVLAGDHLWLVANDSFPGPASTVGPLDSRGVRPGLARIHSETGRMEFRYFPFDSMQGAIGSIAGDDAGNLLLQGDQSSEFVFGGVALAPIPDTVQGGEDLAVVTTGWLALLDSAGHLRRFRQLHGIENMGGWKVRHVPGAGWVALAWDRWDLVGWARLYLFDDDLVLLDSSPRLPSAFDMEIGSDGEILLTGAVREGQLLPSWLRGEGSMWVASCRFGAPAGVSPFGGGVGMPRLVQRGDHLVGVGDLRDEMLVKGFDLLGNRIFQGPLARGARVALPRGTSIWVVEHPGARTVLRATLP